MLHIMTESICATEVSKIDDLSDPMNNDSDADNGTPNETVTFSNALHCLVTVKTYLMQQYVNDEVFSSLHEFEKELFWSHESRKLSDISYSVF